MTPSAPASEVARVELSLEPLIDLEDGSQGCDYTEIGVKYRRLGTAYVWDGHSDGRGACLTPTEAREKAAALLRCAEQAEAAGPFFTA